MTDKERVAVVAAQRATRRVREWRRLQAVRLLADGREAPAVAQALGCGVSSVYYWAEDWRGAGLAGVVDSPHAGGRPRQLDQAAEATLEQLLGEDPPAHGVAATDWTVPLLRTALTQRGEELSERTLRRTLHRLGWRWKRPKYVLGRPDPAYETKKGG
jgi:transposase